MLIVLFGVDKMKKVIIASLIFSSIITASVFGSNISVFLNGEYLKTSSAPVIKNDSVLVPFRDIFEAFGMNVEWNSATSTVTGISDEKTISLSIGSSTGYVNGQAKELSVVPEIINGSTMVPLRFVSEAVGYPVEWDSQNSRVIIGDGYDNSNNKAYFDNGKIILPEIEKNIDIDGIVDESEINNIDTSQEPSLDFGGGYDIDGITDEPMNNGLSVYNEPEGAYTDEFFDEWIGEDQLESNYGISVSWLGEKIILTDKNGDSITVNNAPKSSFEDGKIYSDGNIKFQYVGKFTSNGETLTLNQIYFYREGLSDEGII